MKSSSCKQFWPTAEHRAALRARGIVPISAVALRLGGLAAILLAIPALVGPFVRHLSVPASTVGGKMESAAELSMILREFGSVLALLLPVVGCAIAAVFLIGAIQARTVAGFQQLTPDFSRLGGGLKEIGAGVPRAVGSGVIAVVGFGAAMLLFGQLAPYLLSTLAFPGEDLSALVLELGARLKVTVYWVAGALLVAAILAAVFRFVSFAFEHRMSVEERDAELDS